MLLKQKIFHAKLCFHIFSTVQFCLPLKEIFPPLFSEIFVFLFKAEVGEGSHLCLSAHIHPHGGGGAD